MQNGKLLIFNWLSKTSWLFFAFFVHIWISNIFQARCDEIQKYIYKIKKTCWLNLDSNCVTSVPLSVSRCLRFVCPSNLWAKRLKESEFLACISDRSPNFFFILCNIMNGPIEKLNARASHWNNIIWFKRCWMISMEWSKKICWINWNRDCTRRLCRLLCVHTQVELLSCSIHILYRWENVERKRKNFEAIQYFLTRSFLVIDRVVSLELINKCPCSNRPSPRPLSVGHVAQRPVIT